MARYSDNSTYPILVSSVHGRSGTTLVAEVLSAHPNICISDESWLFHNGSAFMASPDKNSLESSKSAKRRAMKLFIDVLYREYAERNRARRYGDKFPLCGLGMEIEDLLEHRCQWIIVNRNPLDIILSVFERWKPAEIIAMARLTGKVPATHLQAARHEFRVLRTNVVVLTRMQRSFPERIFSCEYERLVSNPTEQFAAMHAFLGERFDASQLTRAFGRRRRTVRMGDPKFNRSQGVHSNSVGRWKSAPLPQLRQFARPFHEFEIGRCMRALGYRRELAELIERCPEFDAGRSSVQAPAKRRS